MWWEIVYFDDSRRGVLILRDGDPQVLAAVVASVRALGCLVEVYAVHRVRVD